MQFKFRRGNIFKIENGVSSQITQEEYEALKGKENGSPKAKVSEEEEETCTDEQEVVFESESGSEEEI